MYYELEFNRENRVLKYKAKLRDTYVEICTIITFMKNSFPSNDKNIIICHMNIIRTHCACFDSMCFIRTYKRFYHEEVVN